MKLYKDLYQLFGIRKADQLVSPPHPVLEKFEVPRESIFHYIGDGDLDHAPETNEPLFASVTHPIYIHHILEMGDKKGNPRRLPTVIDPAIRAYHIKNRRYKRLVSLDAASRDVSSLIVYNYGFIDSLYTVMRSAYSNYYTWWNRRAALWDSVAKLAETSTRQQFIVLKVPKSLPNLSDLALTSGEMTSATLKKFTTAAQFETIELWKWFGDLRHESLINRLPKSALDRVNFLVIDNGHFFIMNLGRAEAWRITPKEEVKAGVDNNKKGIAAPAMQRRFLKSLHVISELRSEAKKLPPAPAPKATGKVIPVMNQSTGQIEMKAELLAPETPHDDVSEPLAPPVDEGPGYEEIHDHQLDEVIEKELKAIADVGAELSKVEQETTGVPDPSVPVVLPSAATVEDGITKICARLAEQDAISASELIKYTKLSKSYKEIPAPDGGKVSLATYIDVQPHELKIEASKSIVDIPTVHDKTMLKSSLHDFDSVYAKKVLGRHVAAMVMNAQQAGIAITGYEVERVEDAIGAFDSITVRNTPVIGQSSTWRIKIPAIREDGTYKSNGVDYRLRKQRADMPIRKVGPSLVALTSYYGKVFVQRSPKRVNNYGEWLCNALVAKGYDDADISVQHVNPGDMFDNLFECPKLYSTLAMRFRSLQVGGFVLNLDHTARETLFGADKIKLLEKDGARILGIATMQTRTMGSQGKILLVVDKNDTLYTFHPGIDKDMQPVGTLESMAHMEVSKAPVEFAEVRILGREIPVGVVLAFEIGFDNMCKLLKVEPRRVQAGTRVNLDINEYSLVFKDETLVFPKDNRLASMLIGGFHEYHRQLREYDAFHFNKRDVYLNILETEGPAARYLREIDLVYQMFVDPITKLLLEEMKEPTNFRGLLLRSCELLLTDQHPDEFDTNFQRFRGNERIAGAVYSEMVKAIREHGGRAGKSKLPIDMHPYAVWKNISTDSSNALISQINPIQSLKEQEAVTTGGTGGRNSRSMTRRTRGYPRGDMGVISESTVDSSDVGINTYTSADPQFNSLLGTTNRYEVGKTGATALLSTSALLAPSSDIDDPKRVNFVGIQRGHMVACKGYHQLPVRTGYEQVIGHRTGDLFSLTAKKAGKVTSVSEKGIIVEYEGGDSQGYELGRRFGNAAGLTLPHNIVTPLREGQSFKAGAPICYNDGFFEPDVFNPGNIIWKGGLLVNVALMESSMTLEDSSGISPRVAELLSTKTTKVNTIVVRFNQKVSRLLKAGTVVEPESILCVIEDEVTASNNLLDEETLDTLSVLSAMVPQAKTNGVVELIEVSYHGDKEDMGESLRAIAEAGDRDRAKRLKASGKKVFTGTTDEGYRVEGVPLALDTMAIKIYITGDVPAGIGDKGVFCNQLKTVFGSVMPGEMRTQSGLLIDAFFGQKSIDDRIVGSPAIIGTTGALLRHLGKQAAAMRKKKK